MRKQEKNYSRRRFIRHAGFAASFWIVPRFVLGGRRNSKKPPSDTMDIAGVGLGARGLTDLQRCRGENITALCDVDWNISSVVFNHYPRAAKYHDYRRMLDSEKNIDALVVATPDHTHAVISAEAIKRDKHVYTEMPLAHDVWETRKLSEIAAANGRVSTQMGNERHSGPSIRETCEWVWSGELGPVKEVQCWTDRPIWPQGIERPKGTPPNPDGLKWDLWLGPAPERPYNPAYHPYRWRGWRDFGTGALGAMGCHIMDAPFWALKLGEARSFTVEPLSTRIYPETYPKASTLRYRFPARADMPPVTITWYDGGRKPPRPKEIPSLRQMGSNGTIFIGEKHKMAFGALTAGTLPGQAGPRMLPEFILRGHPKRIIPRVPDKYGWRTGSRHQQEWITACKKGIQPCSSFDYSCSLTEMVLLGNVAILAGKTIEWNRDKMTITNDPGADKFIRRVYRKGWSL